MDGLSTAVAAARLKTFGPNQLKPSSSKAVLLQFLLQFKNPLVLVLLAGSAVSAFTGDASGAVIVGLIVLMSVTLDFVQSYRAGRATDRLVLQVAVTATVLRDGMPYPVEKRSLEAPVGETLQTPTRRAAEGGGGTSAVDLVFMGSSVVSGQPGDWWSKARRKTCCACARMTRMCWWSDCGAGGCSAHTHQRSV